jgi:8-hydroxy-5-deazaflavin:NADPH oxidoreductase
MDVGVVGGTAGEGFGLALRLAAAGHHVVIGSRSEERGAAAADKARELLGDGANVEGTTNELAAASRELVLVTVPYEGQAEIYRGLKPHVAAGSILVDTTSPLATAVGGRAWQVLRPWHGSAAEQARALLDPGVRIVSAFHTVAGDDLQDVRRPVEGDALVCGDDAEAKALLGEAIDGIPNLRWVDCGELAQARIVEPLTALLISINRRYKIHDAGVRITGRDGWGRPG